MSEFVNNEPYRDIYVSIAALINLVITLLKNAAILQRFFQTTQTLPKPLFLLCSVQFVKSNKENQTTNVR